MELFPSSKIVLSIGNLTVTWYAFLIVSAAILTYYLCMKQFKKWGYSSEVFENFFFAMLPIVIIGARTWFVLFKLSDYINDPIKVFYIWEGGLAIQGGVMAGIIYGVYYFKSKKIDGLRISDVIFPYLMIAQAIGRWGNFINREAHGDIVPESYFNNFPTFIKEGMYINGNYYEPTFLYESLGNILGFIVIVFIIKKLRNNKRGDLAYFYFVWYGCIRFLVEGLRTDSLMMGPIRIAQLLSILFIIFGVLGLCGIYNKIFSKFYPFIKEKPVVIFDLDGTLIDSRELVFSSFKHTFKKYNPEYELSNEELDSFFGPPLKETFTKYFPNENLEEVIQYYRDYNHEYHDELIKEIKDASLVIKTLYEQGYDIAIASNKLKYTVDKGVDLIGIRQYVGAIIGCDDVTSYKPDPECILKCCELLDRGHDNVIYIGDTTSDIKATKNMGGYSIAFVEEESRLEMLKQSKPCRVIHNLKEVLDIVQEEREWSDSTI